MPSSTSNEEIDAFIRQISAEQALGMTRRLWGSVKQRRSEDGLLPRSAYVKALQHAARRILAKLEDAGFDADTWRTYTDFFLQAILAYGTSEVQPYLYLVEQLMAAVLAFPTRPVPLLKEYLYCVVARSTQRRKEMAAYMAQNPSGELSALERGPDLEYDNNFVACVVARPVMDVATVLEGLPTHMTFAHCHAIVHLKLCNPLKIPGCAYVTGGYCCDTCGLRGIRVGFQALVYDDEESDSAESNVDVRSNAQISRKKNYGFDMCMVCAVSFHAQQRENLLALMHAPHVAYAVGHAAGVVVVSAHYHARRHFVSRDSASLRPARALAASPSSKKTSSNSTAVADNNENSGELSDTIVGDSTSSIGSEEGAAAATRSAGKRLPLRPPLRKVGDSVAVAPQPPLTRGAASAGFVISLTLCLAPYGARPIAWVLSDAETHVDMQHMDEMLNQRLGPSSDWRSRVAVRRKNALSVHAAATRRRAAEVPVATSRSATPASVSSAPYTRPSGRALPGAPTVVAQVRSTSRPPANDGNDAGTCAICLCPFEGENPFIETSCHHCFHVGCIEEYTRTAGDVCPLCRASHVLPDMSRSTALAKNTYHVEVTLTEEESLWPYVDVCVGAILTRDGNYRNATSIAAAQCVRMYPNQIRVFDGQAPQTCL
ncbi:hypothetical protein LSCM1_05230 [Leishmania martiniquensis]|uniref:RING-type domain-containing protein n=1 Tax=Leishmania martiniquensis TaxID=1580590 RepID=A0A836H8H0_9TRYP|nr:hypothetical protein LSCM1_05230 [Leishmania martiniquensis]